MELLSQDPCSAPCLNQVAFPTCMGSDTHFISGCRMCVSHSLVLTTPFPCPPVLQLTFINRLSLFQIFSGLALLQKHPRASLTSPVSILVTDLIPKKVVITDLVLGAFVLLIHAAACCSLRTRSCSSCALSESPNEYLIQNLGTGCLPLPQSACATTPHTLPLMVVPAVLLSPFAGSCCQASKPRSLGNLFW